MNSNTYKNGYSFLSFDTLYNCFVYIYQYRQINILFFCV